MSINAKFGNVTAENVSELTIANANGVSLGKVTLEEVAEANHGTLLHTLTEDMSLKTLLTAHPIPLGGITNALVYLKCVGTSVTEGNGYTCNYFMFYVKDGAYAGGAWNYKVGKVAPDTLAPIASLGGITSNTAKIENGSIAVAASTPNDMCFWAGNSMYYIVIPFNFNGTMEV